MSNYFAFATIFLFLATFGLDFYELGRDLTHPSLPYRYLSMIRSLAGLALLVWFVCAIVADNRRMRESVNAGDSILLGTVQIWQTSDCITLRTVRVGFTAMAIVALVYSSARPIFSPRIDLLAAVACLCLAALMIVRATRWRSKYVFDRTRNSLSDNRKFLCRLDEIADVRYQYENFGYAIRLILSERAASKRLLLSTMLDSQDDAIILADMIRAFIGPGSAIPDHVAPIACQGGTQ